jgi:P27 family predicted phage terminase small subunit
MIRGGSMARIGRPPKPTALKVLNGSAAHDPGRLSRDEPIPQGHPVMPIDLSEAEQEVWRHVLAAMPTGVITAVDRDVFRIYCEEVALEREIRGLVGRSGILVRSSSHARRGELTKNPLLAVLRDHATLVRSFASDLGLTPTARTSVHAAPRPNDDRMAALLTPRRRIG